MNRRSGNQLVTLALRLTIVVVLGAIACREERLTGSRRDLSSSLAYQRSKMRPAEAAFAELAARAPSSAGFYLDSSGQLVVVVKDLREDAIARSVAIDFIKSRRIHDPRATASDLHIQRGQYTFNELAAWRDAIFERIFLTREGVSSLDLNEQTNRIVIGLTPELATVIRANLPSELAGLGVDTSAVSFRVHHEVQLDRDATRRRMPINARPALAIFEAGLDSSSIWDTLVGGIYVATDTGAGTLGIVADLGSVRGLITVSHASTQQWYLDQDSIFQSYRGYGRGVGREYADPDWFYCGVSKCRYSDASFFSLASGILSHRGLIVRTEHSAGPNSGYGSIVTDTLQPYLMVTSVDNFDTYTGEVIQKIGRRTGWTWGHITATCTDHSHSGYKTLCAYEADYTDAGGDSGAPVFTFDGGYSQAGDLVKLLGIHFGHLGQTGPAVFSKWGYVDSELGSLNPTRPTNLSAPSISGYKLFNHPVIEWNAISGATRYNVYRIGLNGSAVFVGVTSSPSFSDGDANVLEYTGPTEPTGGVHIQYFVYAVGATEISPKSNVIWYKGASGSFAVGITGPSVVGPNNYDCSQWVAQVTGAATIVSYEWTGLFTSDDYFVQGTVPESGGDVQLLVVDSQDRQGGYIKHITYDPNNQDYCQ